MGLEQIFSAAGNLPRAGCEQPGGIGTRIRICHKQLQRIRVLAAVVVIGEKIPIALKTRV